MTDNLIIDLLIIEKARRRDQRDRDALQLPLPMPDPYTSVEDEPRSEDSRGVVVIDI